MKTTAADLLIDTIHDWGVEVVFGLPVDGINGIMEALRKRADKIRFREFISVDKCQSFKSSTDAMRFVTRSRARQAALIRELAVTNV